MRVTIVRNWWLVALRGAAGVLLGGTAFARAGTALAGAIAIVGAYLVVDGALAWIAGSRGRSPLLLAEGSVGMVAGAVALVWPGVTAAILLTVVATWALVTGATELVAASRLCRLVRNEWCLALSGATSTVLAILLVMQPAAEPVTLIWFLGAYALVFGALLLALAFRLRRGRGPRAAHGM